MSKERYDYELLEKVANRLKELRRINNNQSQENLEEDTKLNIGRIESGRYNVNLTSISVICKYYGITVGEFFKDI